MYKEQYDTGQSKCLISMNESMKSILSKYHIDYKLSQATPLPLRLRKYIEGGIEKQKDTNCYTYKHLEDFVLFYSDCTGNEASNNKVYVETGHDFAKALRMSLKFAFEIADLLAILSDKFYIVISYDDTDFMVSFYCKRDSEEWLVEDLDSYADETIFVITT